jgi:hypothetical protein
VISNILIRKSEKNKLLRIPRHRWKDNTEMDLKEIVCEVAIWSHLAQDKVQWQAYVNVVMKPWVL